MDKNVKDVFEILFGFWRSVSVMAAAKLEISDHLAKQPMTVEQLAAATETHLPSLRRLMRTLEKCQLYERDAQNRYKNTPKGEVLIEGRKQAMKHYFQAIDGIFLAFNDFTSVVKTGKTVLPPSFGASMGDYIGSKPELLASFSKVLADGHENSTCVLPDYYDFTKFKLIVDVGGYVGDDLMQILKVATNTRGVLFDLPEFANNTSKIMTDSSVKGRCSVVPGDFFKDAVPPNGDCYVLKGVIHDWNDEKAPLILANVAKQMKRNETKLLIIEELIAEKDAEDYPLFTDFLMTIMGDGRSRTIAEIEALLSKHNLHVQQVIKTNTDHINIIEVILR